MAQKIEGKKWHDDE